MPSELSLLAIPLSDTSPADHSKIHTTMMASASLAQRTGTAKLFHAWL